ncbi:hypothetical protein TCAL_08960 [Tigriopus californicus]|uniref:RRM domain-containing protein n=1 Tax=Tigriopus californicus TaxID=6832 RepID=A0A553PKM5_TIGCA|nr:DAZ-associated protein 1-like [Tigriopus californicus]XP_059096427.1 DAZ-associated protein 1-like [Tigriopus californicus]TRY78235.1 hypothetical protein TCAL_08960 [Tigriopus californicus]|eukprot:TCALIF_08960-PA protein Name:"Similar to Hrb27C Heterogeneous nuclear ribonucleoprotein 27C (Drosophila melanogaster)" AED:0.04 eAED:0.04 QI:526/1/1/1/0.5/0.4/5/347/498
MTHSPHMGGHGLPNGPPPPRIQGKKHRHNDDEQGKLFVGGLSWDTTQDTLLSYFGRFGEVIDCVVMKNTETGRSRGFGFVTFADPTNIDAVLASVPHSLDGRTIDPKACNPRSMQKPKKSNVAQYYPKVFLGGLPPNITETEIQSFFMRYGNVIEVVIMYDQEKKKSRGFGFLSFADEAACSKAVADHYVMIQNKQVEVKRAEPRTNQGGHDDMDGGGHKMPAMDQWGMAQPISPTPNGHGPGGIQPPNYAGWGPPPVGAPHPAPPSTAYPAQYASPHPSQHRPQHPQAHQPPHPPQWGGPKPQPPPQQPGAPPPHWGAAPAQYGQPPAVSAPASHVPHHPHYQPRGPPAAVGPPPTPPQTVTTYWPGPPTANARPPPMGPPHLHPDPYGHNPPSAVPEYHPAPFQSRPQTQPNAVGPPPSAYPTAYQYALKPAHPSAQAPPPGPGYPSSTVHEFYPHAPSPSGSYTQPDLSGSLGPQRGGAIYAAQPSPYHPYRRNV